MEKTTRPIKQRSMAELLGERKLILASRSPRRTDILKREKVEFAVKIPPDVEGGETSSDPAQHVLSLSRRKAACIAEEVENAIVLGADTECFLHIEETEWKDASSLHRSHSG
jgi:predicted house-cleaning NTP pyrophosphatase (Maf/HAM1 superfamily)